MTDEYGYYPGGDQPMSLRLPSGRTGVFITDPQLRGTVRAIADADKNATNPEFKTYDISPWGEVAADTGSVTRLRLAGQPYDQDSKLYYMRARYYDPQLGRFLSEDPIGISGGLNLYAYAGNDPVNMADPTGLCLESGGYVGSDVICINSPGLFPQSPTFVPDALPPVVNDNGPPGMGNIDGLFNAPPPIDPVIGSDNSKSMQVGEASGGASGSGAMNRTTCTIARALQPVAVLLDYYAVVDGAKAIGAFAEGSYNMAVGSFTRATANLSGRITRTRRLSSGLLAMAGEYNTTAAMVAVADATSISIVTHDTGIRPLTQIPNAVGDLLLTPQVFEATEACAANGY